MASRTINTILNMNDRMSSKLINVSKKVKDLDKDTQRATQRMANMTNKFSNNVNKMVAKSVKFAAIGTAMAGAFALKTGLGEAMNMEGYRTQLITATKSAEKAGKIMKWSVDLANSTPFETGSVIEMSAKYEAMGLSAKKWGGITADMAGATNKDVIQATEAIIDAQTGELERLKEFGLKKADIAKKAGEMFAGQEIINSKGQIVDQEKFNEALMQLMQEKFKGGAAALAKTTKGMWSTVTGVTKTSLANLVGMQNDGTIKSGSMLDKLKGKVQKLADKLTQWQNDGTLDRLGKKFTAVFTTIYNSVSKAYKFIKKYQDVIVFFGTLVVTLSVVSKAISGVKAVVIGLRAAGLLLNSTLLLSPLGWVVLSIAAVVAVGVLLWKNWDTVKEKAQQLWEKIKEIFGKIQEFFKNPIQGLIELVTTEDTEEKGSAKPREKPRGKNALGTSYWRGGPTSINERGGEIIDLPSGSRVIPADKSQNITKNKRNNIFNININAVGKSSEEIMNEFVPKLKLALANM
ncbi:MAG: hypothetical protein JJE17_01755 [Peptostreptococcaceae bacterium]|nr:hypothetical protein [Peptostreptococcaceae bacterium]